MQLLWTCPSHSPYLKLHINNKWGLEFPTSLLNIDRLVAYQCLFYPWKRKIRALFERFIYFQVSKMQFITTAPAGSCGQTNYRIKVQPTSRNGIFLEKIGSSWLDSRPYEGFTLPISKRKSRFICKHLYNPAPPFYPWKRESSAFFARITYFKVSKIKFQYLNIQIFQYSHISIFKYINAQISSLLCVLCEESWIGRRGLQDNSKVCCIDKNKRPQG